MKLNRSRGFTLLEILVVVLIIGLILSLATLTIAPGEGQKLEREAKRIYALMEVVKEEAVLNSQEMAFAMTDEGYGFQVFAVDGWQPLEGDNVLRDRELPEQIRMKLNILGEAIDLAANKKSETSNSDKDENKEDHVGARIFFLSSGEVTPFELFLHFETEEDGFTIVGNELGELEFQARKVTL
jgi:general secretion pathway protein H